MRNNHLRRWGKWKCWQGPHPPLAPPRNHSLPSSAKQAFGIGSPVTETVNCERWIKKKYYASKQLGRKDQKKWEWSKKLNVPKYRKKNGVWCCGRIKKKIGKDQKILCFYQTNWEGSFSNRREKGVWRSKGYQKNDTSQPIEQTLVSMTKVLMHMMWNIHVTNIVLKICVYYIYRTER